MSDEKVSVQRTMKDAFYAILVNLLKNSNQTHTSSLHLSGEKRESRNLRHRIPHL